MLPSGYVCIREFILCIPSGKYVDKNKRILTSSSFFLRRPK